MYWWYEGSVKIGKVFDPSLCYFMHHPRCLPPSFALKEGITCEFPHFSCYNRSWEDDMQSSFKSWVSHWSEFCTISTYNLFARWSCWWIKCHLKVMHWIVPTNHLYIHILGPIAKGEWLHTLPLMRSCVSPSCGSHNIYPLLFHHKWIFHVTLLFVYVEKGHRN
jgi:hypothetical protein